MRSNFIRSPMVNLAAGALSRPSGVALLMVVFILAGLVALVAPFVLSMSLHSRAARSDLNALQAREGADAAVAHGLAQLHKTLRYDPSDLSPLLTALTDLKYPFEFPGAAPSYKNLNFDPQNPKGLLWSLHVEDEQGKININTAPPALIGNLLHSALLTINAHKNDNQITVDDAKGFVLRLGQSQDYVCINGDLLRYNAVQDTTIVLMDPLPRPAGIGTLVFDGRAKMIANYCKNNGGGAVFRPYRSVYEIKSAIAQTAGEAIGPDEFSRIERQLTVCSGMATPAWGRGQQPLEQSTQAESQNFTVENGEGFSPGTLVRVEQNGQAQTFNRVRSTIMRNGSAVITLEDPLGVALNGSGVGNSLYVEPQLKQPINLNTASHEVVVACLMGVCLAGTREAITRDQAEQLASFLTYAQKVYTCDDELYKMLDNAYKKGLITGSQRDAVYFNATETGSPKVRNATVKFCYNSFGSYTIEGSGIVSAENGAELARHTERQLVTMPTPGPGRFKIEYQAGFQELIDEGLTAKVVTFPIPQSKLKNFRKTVTGKQPLTTSGDVRLDVGQCGPFGLPGEWICHCDDENDPRYRPDGYDLNLGQAFILQPSSAQGNNPNPQPHHGFLPGNNNFAPPQGQPGNPAACAPTAVEMWCRLTGGGQCTFYDQAVTDTQNRVTFCYDPAKGLMVQIYDAGLECLDSPPVSKDTQLLQRPPVTCRYKTTLDNGEWYHVAASWKTSAYGGQDIRLDAQPVPTLAGGHKVDPTLLEFKPGGRLAAALSATEVDTMEVTLDDDEQNIFPVKGGAVRVGEEIIEYKQAAGGTLTTLMRGRRMSAIAKHEQGEIVVPYGYVNDLAQDLPVGNSTLTEELYSPNATATHVQPTKPPPNNVVLDTEVNTLPVADATNFPKSGFICVQGELIYYGARTATAFQKLQRGQSAGGAASAARNLFAGSAVVLRSVVIANHTQYDNPGIIQLDNDDNNLQVEWIAYGDKKEVNGNNYFVGRQGQAPPQNIWTGQPTLASPLGAVLVKNQPTIWLGLFRNTYNPIVPAPQKTHSKGTKAIPVVRMTGPQCGGLMETTTTLDPDQVPPNQKIPNTVITFPESPYGDGGVSTVSVVERGMPNGDLRWVKRAYIGQDPWWNFTGPNGGCPAQFGGWSYDFFVGLNDFVSRRYHATQARLMKWPSGELPEAAQAQVCVCVNHEGGGKIPGHVDELKLNSFPTYGGRVAMDVSGQSILADADTIPIEEFDAGPFNGSHISVAPNWPANGGLVRIEDELLFYTTSTNVSVDHYRDIFPPLSVNPPSRANKADHHVINPCPPYTDTVPKNFLTKQIIKLQNVKRGLLGTKAADHPPGAQAMLLDGMPVSILTGAMTANSDTFSVANGAGFPGARETYGYVWIGNGDYDGEVVSYTNGGGAAAAGSFSGCAYFRGRYGTTAMDHAAGDLVRCLPFRYWDREAKYYDGTGLAYIQAGYTDVNAVWDGLELTTGGTAERPEPSGVRPRILVRFDGQPSWDTEPTNQEGGLFEFRNPRRGLLTFAGLQGRGVRADQIEVRVFWEFMPHCFQPASPDWKRTYTIQKLRGTYHSPLVMRRLDEIERR